LEGFGTKRRVFVFLHVLLTVLSPNCRLDACKQQTLLNLSWYIFPSLMDAVDFPPYTHSFNVRQVLEDLQNLCSSVKVLGSFPFVRQPVQVSKVFVKACVQHQHLGCQEWRLC
jgi:hypothetical protein